MNQEATKRHLNIPQLLFALVKAQKTHCIWGRATGKSEGPGSFFTTDNIHAMPRSNGFMMGTTYEQILTRTLPPLIAGWERLGYIQNTHFWVKKYAPSKLKVDKAFRHPETADHYIQWYNGSGIYLVSQDRPGTINGVRTQWGFGDEARLLNKQKMDEEVMPTMAGHADLFGHLSNYLSLLFCSDMPRNSKGKWLLEAVEEMDNELIEKILEIQAGYIKLQEQLPRLSKREYANAVNEMNKMNAYLNELRKETTYVSFASTLDNIHALGLGVIKNFKRQLTDTEFQISILNKQINQIENGFYYSIDEDKHGYDAVNYAFVDGIEFDYKSNIIDKDCRWDRDVNLNEPLDIAADYNNAINSVLIGQANSRTWRFLKDIYVLRPELLKHCAMAFCNYYRFHKTKVVNFIHDNTAIARSASSDFSFADEWREVLENNGWQVNMIYIGQASEHQTRYYAWTKICSEYDKSLPRFEYNKTNCKQWKRSCEGAGLKQVGDKIKKDKSNELDRNTDPQDATHLSEAGDTLFMYYYKELEDSGKYEMSRVSVV